MEVRELCLDIFGEWPSPNNAKTPKLVNVQMMNYNNIVCPMEEFFLFGKCLFVKRIIRDRSTGTTNVIKIATNKLVVLQGEVDYLPLAITEPNRNKQPIKRGFDIEYAFGLPSNRTTVVDFKSLMKEEIIIRLGARSRLEVLLVPIRVVNLELGLAVAVGFDEIVVSDKGRVLKRMYSPLYEEEGESQYKKGGEDQEDDTTTNVVRKEKVVLREIDW